MLIIYLIVLMFINTLNFKQININSIFVNRMTVIIFILSILLNFNVLFFQPIGKGISIFNGLFQISITTQIIEVFFIILGLFILSGWAVKLFNKLNFTNNTKNFSSAYNVNLLFNSLSTEKKSNKESEKKESDEQTMVDNKLLNWANYSEESNISINKSNQYSLVAIFSLLGGTFLMSSLDLLSMYLSIELQSFALYVLASLNKDRLPAASAGLKYFLLGGLSSCFILLGAAIIYSYTGLTHFESIQSLMSSISKENLSAFNTELNILSDINKAFNIGLIIMLIGFLFKVSAAPFYQWSPDVYEATPTIVTVWLTVMAKLTIFIFILGLLENFFSLLPININSLEILNNDNYSFKLNEDNGKNLLLISSLLSLIIGTVSGLSQIKIKRLLAFSSVSHVGFLLLALAIYSINSIDSFIFYLVQYSITSLNIFLIVLAMGYLANKFISPLWLNKNNILPLNTTVNNKVIEEEKNMTHKSKLTDTDLNYIYELKGQFSRNYMLGFSLAICLFSMAGIPPLMGFFGKQFVLYSSIENGNLFLSFVAILVSVISASYYLKLVNYSFFVSSSDTESSTRLLINTNNIKVFSDKQSNREQILNTNENNKGILGLRSIESLTNISNKASQKEELFFISLDISNVHSFIISLLTLLILLFFIHPSIILNGSSYMALNYFNI